MTDTPDVPSRPRDGFAEELTALRERIERFRQSASDPDAQAGSPYLAELETAHEELRVADEEVRAQQQELERLVHSQRMVRWQHDRLIAVLPAPVIVTDSRGVIHTVNASAAALMQMRVDRMLRKPLQAFVDSADLREVRTELNRAVAEQGGFRRTVTLRPREGEPVQVELVATVSHEPWSLATEVTWLLLSTGAQTSTPLLAGTRGALAQALVELTQLPLHSHDPHEILTRAARICQSALGEGAAVSVTMGKPASPTVLASSAKLAQNIDGAQVLADEGPTVMAWQTKEVVRSQDLVRDDRWPRLAQHLEAEGALSAVASPIQVGDDLVGVLTVYSQQADVGIGQLADGAGLLSTAVAAILHEIHVKAELESLARQLQYALDSRPTIDQAKGIIMATRGCDAEEAFSLLVELSSNANIKLRDVAARIVESATKGTPYLEPPAVDPPG